MLSLPSALSERALALHSPQLVKSLDPTSGNSHITALSAVLQQRSPRTVYTTADTASLTSVEIHGKYTVPYLQHFNFLMLSGKTCPFSAAFYLHKCH